MPSGSVYVEKKIQRPFSGSVALPIDFSSEAFAVRLAGGFKELIRRGLETPILVHCTEGKDRAGFVSAFLEALMGASEEEIIADYMESYYNYYGITRKDLERYDIIVRDNIAEMLTTIEYNTGDINKGARVYLEGNGMTDAEVDTLINALAR